MTDKKQLVNILQQLPVGCLLLDPDSGIEFLNQIMENIFGYSLADSRGIHPADLFIPPNGRGPLLTLLHAAENPGNNSQIIEAHTKEGDLIKSKWNSTLLHDEQGEELGTLLTIVDLRIEEQLNRQVQYLRGLRSIDQAILGSVDMHTVLGVILREATTLLEMDAAVVLIYDPNLNVLKFAAGRGLHTNALEFTTLRLGEGYAGKAALYRQSMRIPNLDMEKTDFIRSPSFHKEGFHSYYCAPLLSKGKVIGVLESFHRKHSKSRMVGLL
jgi:PAS domain S-box-containing protein